ncbi:SGNH/GDSL hydrolase family protein [Pseudomonas syringae]
MKKILLLLLLCQSGITLAQEQKVHTRCIIAGDSIQSYVYRKGGIGDASQLTASMIPMKTNVSIANMSGGGQRLSSGGAPGWGLVENLQAIWYVTGSRQPDCVIVALGTNDWGSPEIGLAEYENSYRKVLDYIKEKGAAPVCVVPTWNKEEGVKKPHADGEWTIQEFRDKVVEVCTAEKAHIFDATKIGLKPKDFPDGLHMGEHGHQVFTSALVSQMQEWKLWPKKK